MKKIGSFEPKNRFFLAPMAEINDIAFRLLCKKAGCALTYTGMISPLSKENLILDDKPALQIFASNEKGIEEFIKKYEDYVELFDFNLGCPAKNAKKRCFGYFLQDLKMIKTILKTMRGATKKPITIKLRISKNTKKIIKLAEKYCDAICIHPRTQQQGYSGVPDMKFAEKIKKSAGKPIIYSGNVDENNAEKLLKKFDFVMLGRAAMGKPQIFSKLTGANFDVSFKDYLELALKYNLKFAQIKTQAMNFTKGMKNAGKIRKDIGRAKTLKEIRKIYGM